MGGLGRKPASGWTPIGTTAGSKRVARDFNEVHDRPKHLFVRELRRHAARALRGRRLPPPLGVSEQQVERRCLLPRQELSSLWEVLHREVPKSREAKGLRHRQATMLVIVFTLGLLRRAVQAEARDWIRRNPGSMSVFRVVPNISCGVFWGKRTPGFRLRLAWWCWFCRSARGRRFCRHSTAGAGRTAGL